MVCLSAPFRSLLRFICFFHKILCERHVELVDVSLGIDLIKLKHEQTQYKLQSGNEWPLLCVIEASEMMDSVLGIRTIHLKLSFGITYAYLLDLLCTRWNWRVK